jgi:hypothetical protein
MLSPVSILDKDYDYIEACLEIINKINYKENHPSPRSSSSTARRQLESETNLSSPAAPSQPQQTQSMAGSIPPSDIITSSVAHYKAKIMSIKKDLVDSRKAAAAELENAIKRNQAEKQRHIQQLRDSQKGFEITTHNLEVEQAIFQRQIKENFEADICQTKDAQHSKNKETTKELQKQQENLDAAKIAVELTVKQNQYEVAQGVLPH